MDRSYTEMTLKPTYLSVSAAAAELEVPVETILDKGMIWNGDDKLQLYVRLSDVQAQSVQAQKWERTPDNILALTTKIDGKNISKSDVVLVGHYPVFQQQILTILGGNELDHCFTESENGLALEFQKPLKLGIDDLFIKYEDIEDFLPISSNPKNEQLLFKVFNLGMGLMKEHILPGKFDKIHFSRDDMVDKAAVFGISSTIARQLHKQMSDELKAPKGRPKK